MQFFVFSILGKSKNLTSFFFKSKTESMIPLHGVKISAKTSEQFLRYFQLNIENGISRGTSKILNFYFSANFTEIWFVVSSSAFNKKYILENFHFCIENGIFIENEIFRGTSKISNFDFSANFAEIWFVVSSSGSNHKYILENFHFCIENGIFRGNLAI